MSYDDLPAVAAVPTVARILGASTDTVRALIARSDLGHVRLGRLIRIPRHELVKLLTGSSLEDSNEQSVS